MWPHYDAVAKRCENLFKDYKAGQDIQKYATSGTEDKRVEGKKKRFESPTKQSPTSTLNSSFKP